MLTKAHLKMMNDKKRAFCAIHYRAYLKSWEVTLGDDSVDDAFKSVSDSKPTIDKYNPARIVLVGERDWAFFFVYRGVNMMITVDSKHDYENCKMTNAALSEIRKVIDAFVNENKISFIRSDKATVNKREFW